MHGEELLVDKHTKHGGFHGVWCIHTNGWYSAYTHVAGSGFSKVKVRAAAVLSCWCCSSTLMLDHFADELGMNVVHAIACHA